MRTVQRALRRSPYWPVVTHPVLRRLLPGLAFSSLGNLMSAVAVGWLAIQLAPVDGRAAWVGLAMAASTLPGVVGALVLGPALHGRTGLRLVTADAVLRAVGLGAIPVAHVAGVLDIRGYVALLAASSLLHAWGTAGQYTVLADVLPQRDHLAANATLATFTSVATVLGPAMAGILVAWRGPAVVIAIDAVSFAGLALACVHAGRQARSRQAVPRTAAADVSRVLGFRAIGRDPRLLGLLTLTFVFFLLYGPVQVALPLYVVEEQHAPASTFGAYWTAFGVGALVGGLTAGHLSRWPLHWTTVGTVLVWGTSLSSLGFGAPPVVCLVAMAVGGAAYSPFVATSMALSQRVTSASLLPQVLAARMAVLLLSVPVGALLGGPLVDAFGARGTLLLSAVSTVALGVLAAIVVAGRRTSGALDSESSSAECAG